MTKLKPAHYSGITFDWVVVRELCFTDNPEHYEFEAARDLGANIDIDSRVDNERRVCRVTLRLELSPPDGKDHLFHTLQVAIEGQFSLAAEAQPSVEFEKFAARQGPAILMPFLRDVVATATAQSRFGQVLVPPINVITLMEEIEKDRASAQPTASPAAPGT